MDLSTVFPPDAVAWLNRYGLFTAVVFFAAGFVALLLRPFWLWYSGTSEKIDHLKRIDDTARKALLELEVLNQTLSIPVKRAQKKAQAEEKADAPMVVTQEAKDAFLKVLEQTRSRVQDPEDPE